MPERRQTEIASAAVVIRALDEEAGIGRTLELLAAQRSIPPTESIVVDSGSQDRTREIAHAAGARVLEIAPGDFTFGRALNVGFDASEADVLVALSAHAFPTDPLWLSRALAHFRDPRVACASGEAFGPDGERLVKPVRQDIDLAREAPGWGYSNAAGAVRGELWRQRRWREDLPGSEDKEWALHWLARGQIVVIDPGLVVDHDHSTDPLLDQYRRARREAHGLSMTLESQAPYGLRDLASEWWTDHGSYRSSLRARLSHRRAARLLGSYAGRRERG